MAEELSKLLLTAVTIGLWLFVSLAALVVWRLRSRPIRPRSATVLVLGDIGRSPRMMYHSESLARNGWDTYFVGYGDTPPIPSLLANPRVHLLHVANPPKVLLQKLPWVLRAPLRIAYQLVSVIYLCVFAVPHRSQILLVQNPPSIPTLFLAQLITIAGGTRLIIDWHNEGYSILALRLGPSHPLVRIAKAFEHMFGLNAYAHLFVTRAMERFLVNSWHLSGRTAVLHDRPPRHFHPTGVEEQQRLFRDLASTIEPPLPADLQPKNKEYVIFTTLSSNGPIFRDDRPALVVSSTSWTADEDFSILLTALDAYQAAKSRGRALPRLLVLITGRGELRAPFEVAVARREAAGAWPDVSARCLFLPAADYPVLLGCADLGISMHQSSSGRDLPMKVADMFGCGMPVLARGFACLDELVRDGENGRVFGDAEELAAQLEDTLEGFPRAPRLEALKAFFDPSKRKSAKDGDGEEWSNWDENWDTVMKDGILDFA